MHYTIILSILLTLNLSLLCLAQESGEALQEVNEFSLVQYKDGGGKNWELTGKSAEVEDTKVKIVEISALAYGQDAMFKLKANEGDFDREKSLVHLENNVVLKSTDGTTLTTDSLDWDAESKNVFTEAPVTIKKTDFEVNGLGAVCDLKEKTAKLEKDVTANIKSSGVGPLRDTIHDSRTTILCDGPLEIDYRKNRATFRNNVKVEDIQANIFADRLDVYFSKDSRRIRCIAARGNVKIVNGESVTYSEKAIYLVEQGRLVLPKRPKLVIQGSVD